MSFIIPLLQILLIDVTLAGDNAVVVGLAIAGLPEPQRRRALIFGIGAATLIRVALSAIAVRLLAIVGLTLAGGFLLLWVCWKMYRELRASHAAQNGAGGARKTMWQAMRQIVIADLSMSLDNVLAVAGAARENIWVMAGGLALSVILMGVAASLISRLLARHTWIAWIGLAVVLYVAGEMIVSGWASTAPTLARWSQHLPHIDFAGWHLLPR